MVHRITSPFGTVYVDQDHPNPLIEALGEGAKKAHRHDPVSITPDADIYESENEFLIWMDLPGVDKDTIQVSVSGVTLAVNAETKKLNMKSGHWIKLERRVGSFIRSLYLGEAVTADTIAANYADGTLKITISKEDRTETKQIEVKID